MSQFFFVFLTFLSRTDLNIGFVWCKQIKISIFIIYYEGLYQLHSIKVYLSHDLYTAWTDIERQSVLNSSCSVPLLCY